MDVINIANFNEQSSAQIDASIGLLTNVPAALLNNLGYKFNVNQADNKIEVTILYRDSPESIRDAVEELGGTFIDLGFNFGIVRIPIDKLTELAVNKSIQYIELPKNLYEADVDSNRASCVPQAIDNYGVSGKGVLIGFIDSGIDYTHPAFMNDEGTTRIEYIYDLSTGGNIYDKQMINEAIKSSNPFSIVPSIDNTGHGTHVVGIACAGGRINPRYFGAAPKASIAMVKASRGVAILSSQIMQGIKFLLDKSKELNMPLVVNISLSTNNGAHNGSSLLEQYIRTIANLELISIVVAAGNEGDAGHHVGGELEILQRQTFNVASDETAVVINLYKSILPDISIVLTSPSGSRTSSIRIQEGYIQGGIGKDRYDIYVAGPKPFELDSEVQIILSTNAEYLIEGVWSLEIQILNNYEGRYSIWLPVSEGLNPKTKFLEPNQFNTLGIPATVDNIIAVGSYNYRTNNISSFSGRGAESGGCTLRPDIIAPGENIMGPIPNGGYDSKTGTSMAAPQVSGICALLMEWGIVNGNDPYLFGQRLKYYLVRGANRKRTDIKYPNPIWGYGTVCAFESLEFVSDVLNSIIGIRNSKNNKIQVENNELNIYSHKSNNREINEEAIKDNSLLNDEISLIFQYSNPLAIEEINKNIEGARAVSISVGFGIAILPINKITELELYVEDIVNNLNPPVYTLTAVSPVEASGAYLLSNNPYISLNGRGVLVGIIDTGIDYLNEEFRLEDGKTRILGIWDQTIEGTEMVAGIRYGTEYTENQINEAIEAYSNGGDPYAIVPSKDEIGHGTMNAGIIGGRGINPDLLGAAPDCKFAVVKVRETSKNILSYSGISNAKSPAYRSPQLILGIRYLSELSDKLKMPMVIYFPLGTNIGAHDGTSDIEGVLDIQSLKVGIIPVVGTGNQGDTQTHTEGKFVPNEGISTIEIKIGKNQGDLNFEIYCMKPDKVSLGIVSPSGEVLDRVDAKLGQIRNYKFVYEGTTVDIFYSLPDEITGDEIITVRTRNIREGIWQFRLYGDYIVDGRYWSWLPQKQLIDNDTSFLNPIQYTTLTIPSTSRGVVTTSYYNQNTDSTVGASGRGYTRDGRIKPDITSGGVNAIVTTPGGGTSTVTGSSVATAVLAGCCALILQWAIIDKNDKEIRTQKLISYLIRGTRMRTGDIYPNKEFGYGILDMEKVFESLRIIGSSPLINNRGDDFINEDLRYKNYSKVLEEYQSGIETSVGDLFLRIPKNYN